MKRMRLRPAPSAGAIRSPLQIIIVTVAIALVVVLAYRQFMRIAGAKRPVVVAATDLSKGSILGPDNVRLVRMREGAVPDSALFRTSDAEGLQLVQSRRAGEPILNRDVKESIVERTRSLAEIVPEGRVLTTLKLNNATFPHRDLNRGDRVDVLVAGSSGRTRAARVVARDVFFLGYMTPRTPRQRSSKGGLLGLDLTTMPGKQQQAENVILILALNPKDVVPLAAFDGSGAPISLVLHGEEEVKRGEMLAVEGAPPSRTVEVIMGSERKQVVVE